MLELANPMVSIHVAVKEPGNARNALYTYHSGCIAPASAAVPHSALSAIGWGAAGAGYSFAC